MSTNIRYEWGNEESLDSIKMLWEGLNNLHLEKSPYFKIFYAKNTFEARKATLLSTAQKGQLSVVSAYDETLLVGYCVASIVDGVGEFDSIYISNDYRKKGIANNLMEKVLDWLKQNNPKKVTVKVSVGNEDVFGFYSKYGFYPRLTELQMIPE
jgi:ribosomal protein S18 acetylase RimI-like enzyme